MTSSTGTAPPAAVAFDHIAADYDSTFTFSAIGRSQRDVVWTHLQSVFSPGSHILELNCGTGEDALFMKRAGVRVTACDASPHMIERARMRMAIQCPGPNSEFVPLSTEELDKLPNTHLFDGLLSNFGGLNCVRDLDFVARQLACRLKQGAPLLLCFLSRFCLWEIAYYLLRGNSRKAFRRCSGRSVAHVGAVSFPVYYPTLSELRRIFAPEFRFVSAIGVGVAVPPSYLGPWIERHRKLLRWLEGIDRHCRTWPGLRVLGDHMLLHLERVRPC